MVGYRIDTKHVQRSNKNLVFVFLSVLVEERGGLLCFKFFVQLFLERTDDNDRSDTI